MSRSGVVHQGDGDAIVYYCSEPIFSGSARKAAVLQDLLNGLEGVYQKELGEVEGRNRARIDACLKVFANTPADGEGS